MVHLSHFLDGGGVILFSIDPDTGALTMEDVHEVGLPCRIIRRLPER